MNEDAFWRRDEEEAFMRSGRTARVVNIVFKIVLIIRIDRFWRKKAMAAATQAAKTFIK
jgi:hypothetical protein